MKIKVRVVILSVDEVNNKVYISTDEDLLPSKYLEEGEQPRKVARAISGRVCGVECLEDEFIFSDNLYTRDGILYITYGVLVPNGISDNIELNDFLRRDLNEMDRKIVDQMVYIL